MSWWDERSSTPMKLPKEGSQKKKTGDKSFHKLGNKSPYYQKRIELFERHYQSHLAAIEKAKDLGYAISITLPDGKVVKGIKSATTPMDVALDISKGLASKAIISKVDGMEWDMFRPLEGDCALQIFGFDTPEGKETFWHSSAHVLGQALELEYGVDLTIGPALEEGFYYDCYMGEESTLSEEADKKRLEDRIKKIVGEKQPYQRVEVKPDDALEMFQENKFKQEIISGLPKDAIISVYRCGPMVDLCTGPHVPSTAIFKAFSVTQMSRAHWRGDVNKEPLQRVYAVSFPDAKLLKDYQHRMEEAKKRDHRIVGLQSDLFFFHPLSPGCSFFLPYGTFICNQLQGYIREKYREYRYKEVDTPNIFNFDLWKTSGHAEHYKDNMFSFMVEKQEFGLKPMNCPGHCLLYKHRKRSYRELPLRIADFGVLHRNEASGALSGLTRVRKFRQDDAHIFCRPDQVQQEVLSFLKMLKEVYGVFGLDYELALSTRPEGYIGELDLWNRAEEQLRDALDKVKDQSGLEWREDPGEGAFYGPKIDITVFDALKRKFQCATVQLDFQLPIRFGLEYQTEEQTEATPVIVHRAILGSIERMFAILTEHFAGKWPCWLSPRQVMIVPISEVVSDYALEIEGILWDKGIQVEADLRDLKMQKKVREAQLNQFNYILVVGEAEKEHKKVNVRTRDNVVHGEVSMDSFLLDIQEEISLRSKVSIFSLKSGEGKQAGPQANGNA